MSDSDDEERDSTTGSPPRRLNEWRGLPQKWQALTGDDRGIALSLDCERDGDLGVHLYNAHKLKQRADVLEKDPENEFKDEYPDLPIEAQIFRPRRDWTAWPLNPEKVPRAELFKGEENMEDGMYKKRQRTYASTELEDCLVGVSLKYAKERFQGREDADLDEDVTEEKEEEFIELPEDEYESGDAGERAPRRNMVPVVPHPFLEPVVLVDDERSRTLLRPSVRNTLSRLDEVLMALHHARSTCRRFSMSGEDTDDEERSMAGSMLSSPKKPVGRPRKFEDLVDRSVIPEKEASIKEVLDTEIPTTEVGTEKLNARVKRGRKKKEYPRLLDETEQEYLIRVARIQKKPLPYFAPKLEKKAKKPKVDYMNESGITPLEPTVEPEPEPEKESVDKHRKTYLRLPGETDLEYSARIARLQKKSLPQFAKRRMIQDVEIDRESKAETNTQSPKKGDKGKEHYSSVAQKKLRLRNWSEVLGSAALVGVSEAVLARAAQRCADLFGESMVMRSIVEAPYSDEHAIVEKRYQPGAIPDLGDVTSGDETGMSTDASEMAQPGGKRRNDGRRRTVDKRIRRQKVLPIKKLNIRCPMPECACKRGTYYKHNVALKKHLENRHHVAKEDLNEYIMPSDDETEGAVHVDGFMRPIKEFKPLKHHGVEDIEIKSEEEVVSDGERLFGRTSTGSRSVVDLEDEEEEAVLEHGREEDASDEDPTGGDAEEDIQGLATTKNDRVIRENSTSGSEYGGSE